MAISITHAFVSGIADGADATVVRPSNWNAALVTSMATAKLLGRATAATGAFEEITLGTNLSFTGTTLNAASGSATWDTIGAAAGSTTTANGTNNIVYNTAPTADSKVAWTFGETTAATNGTSTSGVPNQVLLKLATLAASTQSPLSVYSRGNHVFSVSPTTTQILAGSGAAATPIYAYASGTNSGWFWDSSNGAPGMSRLGTQILAFAVSRGDYLSVANGITNISPANCYIEWLASHSLSITDNTAGELVRFTGSSAGGVGSMKPGTTGAFSLGAAALGWSALYLDYTNTATVGNVTINKPSGRVNLGAGGTTLTLTNSLITAASHIFLNADGAPGNIVAVQFYAVAAAGSATINAVPAITNQTAIDFFIVNAD